jgi:putative methionine-R-sulfoxide reductase with GAF domain
MTSLRGPDPYASAEARLAPFFAGQPFAPGEVCRALYETIPTYTWVALARCKGDTLRLVAQHGTPRRPAALTAACAAPLAGDATLVVHDVAAAPGYHACFPDARALIAVPAGPATRLLVTSEHQGAFGRADRALLESVARQLADTPPGE